MRLPLIGVVVSLLFSAAALADSRTTEIEHALQASTGMQADFVQGFIPHGFKTGQVERGSVVFGPAPKMRWTYSAPERKTFVFDGNTSWLYSPAERQVTVTRLDDAAKRQIPFVMISDSSSLHRHFRVQERRKGASTIAEIRPRQRSSPVLEVIATIDRGTRRIRTLTYTDRAGNRTTFEFSNYRKALEADLAFQFSPPSGVDVIETEK